jgi:hypothetical protein
MRLAVSLTHVSNATDPNRSEVCAELVRSLFIALPIGGNDAALRERSATIRSPQEAERLAKARNACAEIWQKDTP